MGDSSLVVGMNPVWICANFAYFAIATSTVTVSSSISKKILLHQIVLPLLFAGHLVVADRHVLARQGREPILLPRLEDRVLHRAGERLGILGLNQRPSACSRP